MKLVKAMATVAGLTGVSRIAGFIRDILTAAILGAGPVADAFFVALKLPNLFRRVSAEGAFSVAFVPLYSEAVEKQGREKADLFASNAFMVMLSILSAVVFVGLIAMPAIIAAIAPGFWSDHLRYDLAVELSRTTFPYLLLMSLTALLGGVLNALDRFAPFAFAPVLFNVCLITALLLNGMFETPGHALAYGVLGAGVLQLIWLVLSARRAKFHLKIKRPVFDDQIKRVFKLMGPGVIGAGVMHINLFADMIIASFLGTGSVSYLYYADRLNQLPLGMVGIAVGTALLPMLSKAFVREDMDEARNLFNRAMEVCLLLALPAAAALFVIPDILISVLFERGAFGPEDTAVSAMVLRGYAIGLPAYIAIKVFSTAHWARQDTVTPVNIAVVATLVNIILSLILVQFIGVAGIAVATGLAGWLQFVAHMRVLRGLPAAQFDARFVQVALAIVLGSLTMAIVVFGTAMYARFELIDSTFSSAIVLVALVLIGMWVYGSFILLSGAFNLKELKGYFSRGNRE